jgi:hypothetical protein
MLDTVPQPEYHQAYMSIWNKILIGFVILGSFVFLYVAARALKTHQFWRTRVVKLEEEIAKTNEETRKVREGDKDKDGKLEDGSLSIKLAEAELRRLLINRGRVWLKCDHKAGKAEPRKDKAGNETTAQLAVVVTPDAGIGGITDKTVLYAFEEAAEGQRDRPSYIGEFMVVALTDKSVVLEPTMSFTADELKRVNASRNMWTLYEVMPADRRDVFAELTEDDKRALLPDVTVSEYVRDGGKADANDPPENKVDGNYVRLLRDYRQLFKICHAERILWLDSIESVTRDATYVQDSLKDAQQQLQFAEAEVTNLNGDADVAKRSLQAVVSHQSAVVTKLKQFQELVARMIRENLEIGAEIARVQQEAVNRINERTRSMVPVARSGTGAN